MSGLDVLRVIKKDFDNRVVDVCVLHSNAGLGERMAKELTDLVPSTRAILSTTIELEIARDVKETSLRRDGLRLCGEVGKRFLDGSAGSRCSASSRSQLP